MSIERRNDITVTLAMKGQAALEVRFECLAATRQPALSLSEVQMILDEHELGACAFNQSGCPV